ncbi:LapA family protein [Oceanobacillus polygoni]|uniref:Integral membrane protein n=1 Tax=Oceanobacillus polygoni TaxID=1235259 RepID=A0A9X1CBZ4_9BACI|nr:lipopolysaccharide assembly protein LapA domain-containing protein [Oceanobacillus polygoni]MBP2077471.1 putative integral membrane protein [Oceanobacillus polygoni]
MTKGQTYVILSIIFVIIVAVFAVTNVDSVEVNYLFWTQESPLILVILFSVLMGGIITASVGAIRIYRLQREAKRLKVENTKLITKLEENGLSVERKIRSSSSKTNDAYSKTK